MIDESNSSLDKLDLSLENESINVDLHKRLLKRKLEMAPNLQLFKISTFDRSETVIT